MTVKTVSKLLKNAADGAESALVARETDRLLKTVAGVFGAWSRTPGAAALTPTGFLLVIIQVSARLASVALDTPALARIDTREVARRLANAYRIALLERIARAQERRKARKQA